MEYTLPSNRPVHREQAAENRACLKGTIEFMLSPQNRNLDTAPVGLVTSFETHFYDYTHGGGEIIQR